MANFLRRTAHALPELDDPEKGALLVICGVLAIFTALALAAWVWLGGTGLLVALPLLLGLGLLMLARVYLS